MNPRTVLPTAVAASGREDVAAMPHTLGRRLVRIAMLWRREIDQELRPFGLTEAQWRPLYWLGRLGENPTQADLARALGLEAPSLVRLIDVLERAGLVQRIEDPSDRRLKRLRMTSAGRDQYAQVERACDAVDTRLMQGIAPDEEALCLRVFDRVDANVRAGEPLGDPPGKSPGEGRAA